MNLNLVDPLLWFHGLLHISLTLLAIPAVLPALYLLRLTLYSGRPRQTPSSLANQAELATHFDILVPAHDEAAGVGGVVHDLLQLDWPRSRFRVVVIADNCSDATADIARTAGATVLERHDRQLRGKGHALQFGFQHCLQQGFAQAFVVIDADTRVSRNLLQVFAQRLASGTEVAQVYHGVLNANHNRRNRLMAIAYSAFHRVRSRGRERLGLSCGIRGNGWCVSLPMLQRVPYAAHGLAEDIEYGLRLGIAGIRVEYIDDAQVLSSMDTDLTGVVSQRNRWEEGRSSLPGLFLGAMLAPAPGLTRTLRRDLGVDLLVPPLATIGLALLLLLMVATLARWSVPSSLFPKICIGLAVAGALGLVVHVARAWQLSETGVRGLIDLAMAPRFALWKLALRFRPTHGTAWVRTHRLSP